MENTLEQLAKSHDICSSFQLQGITIPRNPERIRQILFKQYEMSKLHVVSHLNKLKQSQKFFSITLDEYTSCQNQHYANVNIHCYEDFFNLGLVFIEGSLTSEETVNLVSKRLKEFGLDLEKDVVSATTDGASVMNKFGRSIGPEHLTCMAHGIHLAVCDVLYAGRTLSGKDEEERDFFDHEDINEIEEEDGTDENEGDVNPCLEDNKSYNEEENEYSDEGSNFTEFTIEIDIVVRKVRKVVILFRKSPVKNASLQRKVKEMHGVNNHLILDTKTRWSSLFNMLKRFVKLWSCIQATLILLGINHNISEQEMEAIVDLVEVLEPFKLAVEALCDRRVTALSAERIFRILLDALKLKKTSVSLELQKAVFDRIASRRKPTLVHLFEFLNNPAFVLKKKITLVKRFPNQQLSSLQKIY
jgi:hypothetical protein